MTSMTGRIGLPARPSPRARPTSLHPPRAGVPKPGCASGAGRCAPWYPRTRDRQEGGRPPPASPGRHLSRRPAAGAGTGTTRKPLLAAGTARPALSRQHAAARGDGELAGRGDDRAARRAAVALALDLAEDLAVHPGGGGHRPAP